MLVLTGAVQSTDHWRSLRSIMTQTCYAETQLSAQANSIPIKTEMTTECYSAENRQIVTDFRLKIQQYFLLFVLPTHVFLTLVTGSTGYDDKDCVGTDHRLLCIVIVQKLLYIRLRLNTEKRFLQRNGKSGKTHRRQNCAMVRRWRIFA